MIQAVEAVSYVGMCGDGYARRRVHLPARMRGCGIRSLATLAPIAYCACFIESAEVMLDGSVGVTAPRARLRPFAACRANPHARTLDST